jgi:hypothetical protein
MSNHQTTLPLPLSQSVLQYQGTREDLTQWAFEQMAQHLGQARPMRDEDAFIGDMTVKAYFTLPEPERERIWDELYATAIETAQEREVNPNTVVSAG